MGWGWKVSMDEKVVGVRMWPEYDEMGLPLIFSSEESTS
jgi:hypothetical protein